MKRPTSVLLSIVGIVALVGAIALVGVNRPKVQSGNVRVGTVFTVVYPDGGIAGAGNGRPQPTYQTQRFVVRDVLDGALICRPVDE